jgi:RNA polymerase sigma-70 factor (ECF subfamily)
VEIEDVFRSYERAVFAYFLRVVGDRHDAEELTQETFVRACAAIVRFRGDAAVSTWLFGIARRVLLEASRRGLFDRPRSVADVDAPIDPPDHDVRLDLEAAFAELEPVDREVLMLVDFLGFGSGEAAGILGIEAGAFRMRLHRARGRLRRRLEEP